MNGTITTPPVRDDVLLERPDTAPSRPGENRSSEAPRFLRGGLAILSLLNWMLAGGCAHTTEYRPSRSVEDGDVALSAAYYELAVGDRSWGDVKVWSEGAHPKHSGDGRPVIHVGLRVRNDQGKPIDVAVDRVNLELLTSGERGLVVVESTSNSGATTVPAGEMERLAFNFSLPPDLTPHDVPSFEFNWAVRTPTGIYTESTPFVRWNTHYDWRPYGPYGPYGAYGPYYWRYDRYDRRFDWRPSDYGYEPYE